VGRTTIQLRAIKPGKLRVDQIRLELLNALRHQGVEHQQRMRQTVKSWRGERPHFVSAISLRGGDAVIVTYPQGSELAVNKWHWLEAGTRTRWAMMSTNWKSKTRPGSFRSGGGAGRVLFFGKKAFRRMGLKARPGIKPRKWTEQVRKERRRPFIRDMERAVSRGAKKAFSGGDEG
jgi:hypothetical protein